MSEMGQKRRFDPLPATSGPPPNNGHHQIDPVSPVHANPEVAVLFDHLVGAGATRYNVSVTCGGAAQNTKKLPPLHVRRQAQEAGLQRLKQVLF
jgi:hypothetical protein